MDSFCFDRNYISKISENDAILKQEEEQEKRIVELQRLHFPPSSICRAGKFEIEMRPSSSSNDDALESFVQRIEVSEWLMEENVKQVYELARRNEEKSAAIGELWRHIGELEVENKKLVHELARRNEEKRAAIGELWRRIAELEMENRKLVGEEDGIFLRLQRTAKKKMKRALQLRRLLPRRRLLLPALSSRKLGRS
ncbi:hypothetical protein Cni_G11269 [Canna indica]|uniref:Uncharacterized protein n=1 Tax=Canna indica TaxID=4628 RepID=A0AAQ3QBJ7_9LILI|nr:hypothetical protein Cni_G11269 [Canna indica]